MHFSAAAFAVLRFAKPIASVGGTTLVTRFADVQEVLSRPDVFGVFCAGRIARITDGGSFLLGMEDTPAYRRDASNLQAVMPREDVPAVIGPLIRRACEEAVAASPGSMDFVRELAGPVPARLVQAYMGISNIAVADLVDRATSMFRYLFIPRNSMASKNEALEHAARTRMDLDRLIADRKANQCRGPRTGQDDVVGRCLALQQSGVAGMGDTDIRNNLMGLMIGAIPTTASCAALVLDYLLDHPTLLIYAQQAALRGDTELLLRLALEALRFNSFGGALFRVASRDHVLAEGTLRRTMVRKGQLVWVSTESAMFDGRHVPGPKSFRVDRPLDHYLHFGHGMHRCLGHHVNMVQIPAILEAVLKCRNLRRAAGHPRTGRAGPFVKRLGVEFDR